MSLIDKFEILIGYLGEKVETFSGNRTRVVIGGALAAGLSIPVAHFGFLRISVMWRINTPSWAFILTTALACVTCYMAAALLLILAKVDKNIALSRILAVVLGSFILAVFADVWRNDEIWQLSLDALIFVHLRDALERTIWLSLFTLPFAALVNYSGGIVRSVRRWHHGQSYSLSVWGK